MIDEEQSILNFRENPQVIDEIDSLVFKKKFRSRSDFLRKSVADMLHRHSVSVNADTQVFRIPKRLLKWLERNVIQKGEVLNLEFLVIKLLQDYKENMEEKVRVENEMLKAKELEHEKALARVKHLEHEIEELRY